MEVKTAHEMADVIRNHNGALLSARIEDGAVVFELLGHHRTIIFFEDLCEGDEEYCYEIRGSMIFFTKAENEDSLAAELKKDLRPVLQHLREEEISSQRQKFEECLAKARMLEHVGDLRSAIDMYNQAAREIERDDMERYGYCRFQQAQLYESLGEFEKGMNAMREALYHAPDNLTIRIEGTVH